MSSTYDYALADFAGYLADVEANVSKKLLAVIETFSHSRVDLPLKKLDEVAKVHERASRYLRRSVDPKKADNLNLWKLCNIYSILAVDLDKAMQETRKCIRKRIDKEKEAPEVATTREIASPCEKPKSGMRRFIDDYRPSRRIFNHSEPQLETFDDESASNKDKSNWVKRLLKDDKRPERPARTTAPTNAVGSLAVNPQEEDDAGHQRQPPTASPKAASRSLHLLVQRKEDVEQTSSRPPRPPRPPISAMMSIQEHSLRHTDDGVSKKGNVEGSAGQPNPWNESLINWNTDVGSHDAKGRRSSPSPPPLPTTSPYQNLAPRPPDLAAKPRFYIKTGSSSPETTVPSLSPRPARAFAPVFPQPNLVPENVPPTLISIDADEPTVKPTYYSSPSSNRCGLVFVDGRPLPSNSNNPSQSNGGPKVTTTTMTTTTSSYSTNDHVTKFDIDARLPASDDPSRTLRVNSSEDLRRRAGGTTNRS